jgi:hypothetical protein
MSSAPENRFWAVADYFRKVGRPWLPSTAGFELWRFVKNGRTSWSVCMKVHAVPTRSGPGGPIQFKASVTLWSATQGGRVLPQDAEWKSKTRRLLSRVGYRGNWMDSPDGQFGDFWKDLPGPAAVRREVKVLEALDLAPEHAPAPRTAHRPSRGGGRRSR